MRVLTDYPDQLRELDYVYLGVSPDDRRLEKRPLKRLRFNKEYALLTLDGFADRNAAERLRGLLVMIDSDQAAPLADGEYFLFELIGLKVVADNVEVGCVKEVLQTGANDVYIVEGERYGEILIPAHAETIEQIDFAMNTITMSLPEGLLPAE